MNIFQFEDFREYVFREIKSKPNGGRGELLKISKHAKLHTTSLSQILKGDRVISMEHALSLAEYFGLSEAETRYFLLLIQYDRAATKELKAHLKKQIDESKSEHTELVRVLNRDRVLSEHEKALFYSNWFFSGVRVLTSIPGFQSTDAIARRFGLSKQLVNEVVQFLLSTGLCEEKEGKLQPGPQYTHLESGSKFVSRHHSNWRLLAMNKHPTLSQEELAYTSPMSLSVNAAQEVREVLVEAVRKVNQIRENSVSCETTFCLNLDWFRF